MMTEPESHITQAAIFRDLEPEWVEALCRQGRRFTGEPKQMLFERGDDARELLLLTQGVVELLFPVHVMGFTREVTMETKQPGDVVAWSAVISPYHYTLSARCANRCTLLGFERDMLMSFFREHPEAGFLFMRNLAGVIAARLQGIQMMWMRDLQAGTARTP